MEMEQHRIFMNNIIFLWNSIGRGNIEIMISYNRTTWYLSMKKNV